MVRRDRLRGIVDIEHTNGSVQSTDRWLVVKKLLDKAYKVSTWDYFLCTCSEQSMVYGIYIAYI